MEKQELDAKITEVSKTILSYCMARTSNQYEAEDLSQDIIVEIIKSSPNIRDDKAFYGFMWAIAGNVYKNWCKKKSKANTCEIPEDMKDDSDDYESLFEDDTDIFLLRRELSLISEKYRKATVLYYVENKSCSEIAALLSISESMVKYLLFKSRKILKEGMNMTRTYGEQSYNPKKLDLMYLGNGKNVYYKLCEDNPIAQNILMACYNDLLSEEEISLQIGVPVAYLQKDMNSLLEHGVLIRQGSKYSTNIVVLTNDFQNEIKLKSQDGKKEIAKIVANAITEKEEAVRKVINCDISHNEYMWRAMGAVLYSALNNTLDKLDEKIEENAKVTSVNRDLVVGREDFDIEDIDFAIAVCREENRVGDALQFIEFTVDGNMDWIHNFFFKNNAAINIFIDIAKGNIKDFSKNDFEIIAEMIKKGYVKKDGEKLSVNSIILTQNQLKEIYNIFEDTINEIQEKAYAEIEKMAKILAQYVPKHVKFDLMKTISISTPELFLHEIPKVIYDNNIINSIDETDNVATTVILK